MAWVQHGIVLEDDGQHTDEQIGNAASVRFTDPDKPGARVTVYAYPHAPERFDYPDCPHEVVLLEDLGGGVGWFAPMPPEHLACSYHMDRLGIQILTMLELLEDEDVSGDSDDWEPTWDKMEYELLDTRDYGGDVTAAQTDALAWIRRFDANRAIHWDGKRN